MPGSATLTETVELLRKAAQLIRDAGYKPWAPAGSEPGYSLSTALCTVTGCDPSGRHNPACLALHTRLAGLPVPERPDHRGWRLPARCRGDLGGIRPVPRTAHRRGRHRHPRARRRDHRRASA